ncbi:site-specific integrase [Vibrio vulnificus]|nr:site-specific integrase [Vibrio vulnificus]EJN6713309.1 site-specific integrase [Vibrio vulnificus]
MAQVAITSKLISQCVANGKEQFYFDTLITGFYIKITPKGRISFYLRAQYQGERPFYFIGRASSMSVDDARQKAKALLLEHRGESCARLETNFSDFGQWFFQHYSSHWKREKTRLSNWRLFINKLEPEFGHLTLDDIDARLVKCWLSKQSQKDHTPLALLSVMMKQGIIYGYRSKANPCKGLRKRKHDGRMRYLNHAELQRLWQTLDNSDELPLVLTIFRLLLLTGCRNGEIRQLKKSEYRHGHLYLGDSKTGAKTVYLSSRAVSLLNDAKLFSDDRDYLFPNPYSKKSEPITYAELRKAWMRICLIAQIEACTIHDLRHSYASFALQSGEHLLTISHLLGHSDANTTLRYAHLAKNHIYQAAEKVSSALAKGLSL